MKQKFLFIIILLLFSVNLGALDYQDSVKNNKSQVLREYDNKWRKRGIITCSCLVPPVSLLLLTLLHEENGMTEIYDLLQAAYAFAIKPKKFKSKHARLLAKCCDRVQHNFGAKKWDTDKIVERLILYRNMPIGSKEIWEQKSFKFSISELINYLFSPLNNFKQDCKEQRNFIKNHEAIFTRVGLSDY